MKRGLGEGWLISALVLFIQKEQVKHDTENKFTAQIPITT